MRHAEEPCRVGIYDIPVGTELAVSMLVAKLIVIILSSHPAQFPASCNVEKAKNLAGCLAIIILSCVACNHNMPNSYLPQPSSIIINYDRE